MDNLAELRAIAKEINLVSREKRVTGVLASDESFIIRKRGYSSARPYSFELAKHHLEYDLYWARRGALTKKINSVLSVVKIGRSLDYLIESMAWGCLEPDYEEGQEVPYYSTKDSLSLYRFDELINITIYIGWESGERVCRVEIQDSDPECLGDTFEVNGNEWEIDLTVCKAWIAMWLWKLLKPQKVEVPPIKPMKPIWSIMEDTTKLFMDSLSRKVASDLGIELDKD